MDFLRLVVLYGLFNYVSAIEPISVFGAIGSVLLAGLYTVVYGPIGCQYRECCTKDYIDFNLSGIY